MSRGNRMSLFEAVKRREPNITGVKQKISQQESQKIEFIVKVLDYALEHNTFSVIDLQKNLCISRNSIDRTIKLLLEKRFIILSSVGLKNEKFYKIKSRIKVKQYRNDLNKWKWFKISLKTLLKKESLHMLDQYQRKLKQIGKIIQRNSKLSKFQARNISFLESIPLHLKKKQQEQITDIPYPKTVYLKSIDFTPAFKIVEKYLSYRLCDICLKKGKLVDVHNISETEVVCIEFGHTFSVDE